jgi:hypothetical protein
LKSGLIDIANKFSFELKHLFLGYLRSGKARENPEFKEKLEEIVRAMGNEKRRTLEPDDKPIQDKEKQINDLDNTVTPAAADRQGGEGGEGGGG